MDGSPTNSASEDLSLLVVHVEVPLGERSIRTEWPFEKKCWPVVDMGNRVVARVKLFARVAASPT